MKKSTKIAKGKGKNRPDRKPASSSGLGNPVAAAIGLEASKQAFRVLPWLIAGGVVYFIYRKWNNRFIPLKEKSNYPDANITKSQAESKADLIYSLKPMFGEPDFEPIRDALSNLNYNGFVRLYNAFGHRDGSLLDGNLNLIEWLQDQMTAEHFKMLGALQNHVFF